MRQFTWILCLILVSEVSSSLKPRTYYFENECENAYDNQALRFIGIDEQVRIRSTQNESYSASYRCFYTLSSSPGDKFMFYFKGLDMEENECANDWITFFDGDITSTVIIGNQKYCGQTKPFDVFVSSGPDLTIYFQSNAVLERGGFDIIVTVFHEGSCMNFESKCDNGRCIHGDLACNGYNPCGDFSDCDDGSDGNYVGIIIGGSSAVFILIVVVVAVVAFVKCRHRHAMRSLGKQGYVENPPPQIQGLPMQTTTGTPISDTTTKGEQPLQPDALYNQAMPPIYATINDTYN